MRHPLRSAGSNPARGGDPGHFEPAPALHGGNVPELAPGPVTTDSTKPDHRTMLNLRCPRRRARRESNYFVVTVVVVPLSLLFVDAATATAATAAAAAIMPAVIPPAAAAEAPAAPAPPAPLDGCCAKALPATNKDATKIASAFFIFSPWWIDDANSKFALKLRINTSL
jgi:hypothetical protein